MLTHKQLELINYKINLENIKTSRLARQLHISNGVLLKVLSREISNHRAEYRLVLWSQGKPIFLEGYECLKVKMN